MWSKAYWRDLTERVVATFAAALVGVGAVVDFTDRKTYQAAGVVALVTFLKCLAARRVGAPDSAALLKPDEP